MRYQETYEIIDTDTGKAIRSHPIYASLRLWAWSMNIGEGRARYTVRVRP